MPGPTSPYQPYAAVHEHPNGAGDARPTALQVVQDCKKIGALKGKTVLITGCSSGIGVETARALYEAGATLFLTARDLPKLQKVIDDIVSQAKFNHTGPHPRGLRMHLEDLASVRTAASEFQTESDGDLDILILNAGIAMCPYGTTKDGFETQIGVNHFAHFLLFQELQPLLTRSAQKHKTTARVIAVSSGAHRQTRVLFTDRASLDAWNRGEGYDAAKAYGSSKTANIWMANSLSRRYAKDGLLGLSVHPGPIRTEVGRYIGDEAASKIFDSPDVAPIMKSIEQGAATSVWAAVADHFEGKTEGVYLADVAESGAMGVKEGPGQPGYKEWAYDEEAEEKLWELSLEVVASKK